MISSLIFFKWTTHTHKLKSVNQALKNIPAQPLFVTVVSWRDDLLCGTEYPLANGDPAQCDPNNSIGFTCCSSGGWCGKTSSHCKCDGCIDYKPKTDTTKKGTSNATAISKCKVKCTACPGYIYAKRNVKQCSQCGGSVHLKCWKDRL